MAQPTNTFDTYDAVGNREDLSDIIHNIAPTETPFWMSLPAGQKATAVRHEWQTDTLAAATAANAVIEGDDATLEAVVPTVRLNNVCQISDKTVVITGTQDAVNKAGRAKELTYQVEKKGRELKRDVESAICQNGPHLIGNSSTARRLAGFETWIHTNQSRGAGGAAAANTNDQPDNNAPPTDGTQRAFSEANFKSVRQQIWTQGGDATLTIVGPFNKRAASAFTGNSTREIMAGEKKLVSAVDVYVDDYGTTTFAASRFSRDRSALLIDPEYWALSWLRPIATWPLAKTGDTEKRQILGEYTLEAREQKSSGIVADLTTS